MPSAFGPYVEELAERVERITLATHDPPDSSNLAEATAEYEARPTRDNLNVLSLGPLGSRSGHLGRMRRIKAIFGPASERWDVLLLRFGRRAHLALRANRCPRTAALVWGSPSAARQSGDWLRHPLRAILASRSEWHLRRAVRGSQVLVSDGEDCLARYGHLAPATALIRSASRREVHRHDADDRLVDEDPRFLFVGHVTIEKGILDAIEAFRGIKERNFPGACLDVVGAGSALDEARSSARNLGDAVTFHGWIPAGNRLFDIYRRADVLLFLSRAATESFPRVVTEAMAHSVLVISTPVGSLPAALQDGRDLLFTPIGDPEAARMAVESLSRDETLRRRLLAAGRARAEGFSVEATVDALLRKIVEMWPGLETDEGTGCAALP